MKTVAIAALLLLSSACAEQNRYLVSATPPPAGDLGCSGDEMPVAQAYYRGKYKWTCGPAPSCPDATEPVWTPVDRSNDGAVQARARCLKQCALGETRRSSGECKALASSERRHDRQVASFRVRLGLPETGLGYVIQLQRCQTGDSDDCSPAAHVPIFWMIRESEPDPVLLRLGSTNDDGTLRSSEFQPNSPLHLFVARDTGAPGYGEQEGRLELHPQTFAAMCASLHASPGECSTITTIDGTVYTASSVAKQNAHTAELIAGLVDIGTVTPGKEFDERITAVVDAKWAQRDRDIEARASALMDRCQSTPSIASCTEMLSYVSDKRRPDLLARAEQVATAVRSALDDEQWGSAFPSCTAPTTEDACDPVKAYLERYPGGAHANQATELLRRAAPTLAALAQQRQEAIKAIAASKREQEARIYEACVATCRSRGDVAPDECSRRCR